VIVLISLSNIDDRGEGKFPELTEKLTTPALALD